MKSGVSPSWLLRFIRTVEQPRDTQTGHIFDIERLRSGILATRGSDTRKENVDDDAAEFIPSGKRFSLTEMETSLPYRAVSFDVMTRFALALNVTRFTRASFTFTVTVTRRPGACESVGMDGGHGKRGRAITIYVNTCLSVYATTEAEGYVSIRRGCREIK